MLLKPNPFMKGQNVDQIGGEDNRERERFYYGRYLTLKNQ